jgi:parallel beta-helix repeat protein
MSFLFNNPWNQFTSGSSSVYAGAKLYFYKTGTTTNQAIYQDSALTTAHTNPVVADASGYFDPIYLDNSLTAYKSVLKDADGNTLQTADPINPDYYPINAVNTLSALKALTPPSSGSAIVFMIGRTSVADGGEGVFVWDDSDLATEVTVDSLSGIYVPPNSDTSGSSGAWVRNNVTAVVPEMYGAVGDGITLDTVPVQAALDSGFSVNGIPGKNYRIVGLTLDISSPIVFDLKGAELSTTSTTTLLTVDNAAHITRNGVYYGGNLNGNYNGIYVGSNADGAIVENNNVQYIGGSGIVIDDSDNVTVKNNKLVSCAAAADALGANVYALYAYHAQNLKLMDNYLFACNAGIYCLGEASPNRMSGLICTGNNIDVLLEKYGIFLYYNDDAIVNGNVINGNGAIQYGILTTLCRYSSIFDNLVRDIDQHGIYIASGSLQTIARNTIRNPNQASSTYAGIYTDNVTNYSFVDYNVVISDADYAVIVAGGIDNSVRGNRGYSMGTGMLSDSGTSTTAIDNVGI